MPIPPNPCLVPQTLRSNESKGELTRIAFFRSSVTSQFRGIVEIAELRPGNGLRLWTKVDGNPFQ